jgi:hypothetical protein
MPDRGQHQPGILTLFSFLLLLSKNALSYFLKNLLTDKVLPFFIYSIFTPYSQFLPIRNSTIVNFLQSK